MSALRLILASASPRRAELLRAAGLEFEIVPSAVAETLNENLTVGELAQINAYRKARSVSKKFPDAITMGVDTLVTLNGQIFAKPPSMDAAHQMLLALQGATHQVVTGVCLIHLRGHRQHMFIEQSDVTFRPMTLDQVRHYHARVNPLDKAGAYGIQEHGAWIVATVDGSFSNVVGLPMGRTLAALAAFDAPAAE